MINESIPISGGGQFMAAGGTQVATSRHPQDRPHICLKPMFPDDGRV